VHAEACERSGSRLYADLARRLAEEPLVREIACDDRWDFPVRLLGGLHYLVLAGRAPGWRWEDVRATLERESAWLAAFTAEQRVQTNEVQRSWAILPAFLLLAEARLDLIELGPSAGLNLLWDRYRYRYAARAWGPTDSPVELVGEERSPVGAELLSRRVDVGRRVGIEFAPVDLSDQHGVRLLECFVWPDQTDRMDRLRRALEMARAEPPEIIHGDYVDVLPQLLAEREQEALTVVFQTVSTMYLPAVRYRELRRIVDEADPPVAWISTRRRTEEETELQGGFELELRGRSGPARLVARMGYHGQWLDWLAA
jgi:hypothetical protein